MVRYLAFPVTLKIKKVDHNEVELDEDSNGDDADSDKGSGDDRRFTFHPQTEALIQWFTQTGPSDAFQGAFSYPGLTALPAPAKPCPQ